VRVMTLDFLALTALMPFFMSWDAEAWVGRPLASGCLSCQMPAHRPCGLLDTAAQDAARAKETL
jgi:hypothetical protein